MFEYVTFSLILNVTCVLNNITASMTIIAEGRFFVIYNYI